MQVLSVRMVIVMDGVCMSGCEMTIMTCSAQLNVSRGKLLYMRVSRRDILPLSILSLITTWAYIVAMCWNLLAFSSLYLHTMKSDVIMTNGAPCCDSETEPICEWIQLWWLIDWLIDCLIWLIYWFIDWLIDFQWACAGLSTSCHVTRALRMELVTSLLFHEVRYGFHLKQYYRYRYKCWIQKPIALWNRWQ